MVPVYTPHRKQIKHHNLTILHTDQSHKNIGLRLERFYQQNFGKIKFDIGCAQIHVVEYILLMLGQEEQRSKKDGDILPDKVELAEVNESRHLQLEPPPSQWHIREVHTICICVPWKILDQRYSPHL